MQINKLFHTIPILCIIASFIFMILGIRYLFKGVEEKAYFDSLLKNKKLNWSAFLMFEFLAALCLIYPIYIVIF